MAQQTKSKATKKALAKLFTAYASGADRVAAAIDGMSPKHLQARPIPGQWTTMELVAHLSDSEQVAADRMRRIIAMETPLIIGYDESKFVANLHYSKRDPAEEITIIRLVRSQMLRTLTALPLDAFDRVGVHNEAGLISLFELLGKMVWHLDYHLAFVTRKRKKLGV